MQGTATPVSPTENTDFHGNLSALSFLCCSVCSVGITKRIYICIAKFGAKEKAVEKSFSGMDARKVYYRRERIELREKRET